MKQLIELNAQQLGLLRQSDFVEFDAAMEVNERKQYVSTISGILELLQRELRFAMAKQLEHIGQTAENWEQVLIGRGGINSLSVLLERFEKMNTEHQVNIKPKDIPGKDFDPHSPIAE
jgi:hypothetical protein